MSGRSARSPRRGARRAVCYIFFKVWPMLVTVHGQTSKKDAAPIPNACATVDYFCRQKILKHNLLFFNLITKVV